MLHQQTNYPDTELTWRRPYRELPAFPRFFSLPLEVLLRTFIGKSYISKSLIFWSFVWLAGLTYTFYEGINIGGYQILRPSLPTAALFGLFASSFLVTSLMHKRDMSAYESWVRNEMREEPTIGSWDDGRVRAFWQHVPVPFIDISIINESTIKRFFEPLPVLAVGAFLFFFISEVFGGYLVFSGLVLLYTNHKTYNMLDRDMTAHADGLLNEVAMKERLTPLEMTLHRGLQNGALGPERQMEYFKARRKEGKKSGEDLPQNRPSRAKPPIVQSKRPPEY